MADELVKEALTLLDRPVHPPRDFAEDLFAVLLEQIAEPAPVLDRHRDPRTPAIRRWYRPARGRRLSLVAAAAVVGILVAVSVIRDVAQPRSALAIIEDARERFAAAGPFEAEVFRRHPAADIGDLPEGADPAGVPDLEILRAVQFQDEQHWRTTVRSNSYASAPPLLAGIAPERSGDFTVASGDLLGRYDAGARRLSVLPAEEVDSTSRLDEATASIAPQFASRYPWLTDQFFRDNCARDDDAELLDRRAHTIRCSTAPERDDLRLSIDVETGLLLRLQKTTDDHGRTLDVPHLIEVRSLNTAPEFTEGTFSLTPPSGAKVRWEGAGPAPAAYRIEPGREVTATISLGGPVSAVATGDDGVFALVRAKPWTGGDPPPQRLAKIDPVTDEVAWTVPVDAWAGSIAVADGRVWVGSSRLDAYGTETSFQRNSSVLAAFDSSTGEVAAKPVVREAASDSGAIATSPGSVWFTGGPADNRTFPRGARMGQPGTATIQYTTLQHIDATTLHVRHEIALGARALGVSPVLAGTTLWVAAEYVAPDDPTGPTRYALLGVDTVRAAIVRRVELGFSPSSVAAAGTVVWAIDVLGRRVHRIDTATDARISAETGSEPAGVVATAGSIWVTDLTDGTVRRLDPQSLVPRATLTVGGAPGAIGADDRALWIADIRDGTIKRADVR